MDELQSRLMNEHDAVHGSLPDGGPEVLALVRRGARRRRQVRALATGAAAVLAVGAIGVGAWGLAGTNRADTLEPMVSDTPTPVASPVPQVQADVTAAPAPTAGAVDVMAGPRVDDSPDGIPEDEYPPLAADRNTAKSAASGITYPRAHVIEDWVWDRTGPGWSLEIASMQLNPYEDGWEQPAAVMYLMSPEERYFEVTELPERAWDDVRVVSWREGTDTAMIWWADNDAEEGRVGAAGAVDLRTGALDDLRMAVYGDSAYDYRFVMANAAGDELWKATSAAGFKYYRWSQGADEDGWVASALVDQAPTADNAVLDIGYNAFVVADDGDRVMLSTNGDGYDGPPVTNLPLLTYDLSSDSIRRHPISLPVEIGSLYGARFDGKDAVIGWVNTHIDSPDGTFDHELFGGPIRIALNGSGTAVRTDREAGEFAEPRTPVPYGAASPIGVGAEACGC